MLTSALSIVVHQTMACWRHHFPLLCVKQCNADVSTFHCVSLHTETHFVPDLETDSVWRVIEGKWCFGSGIRIRSPDHHQNLMEWSLGSWLPSHYISFKSVHNVLSNPANRQTNKRGGIHNIRPTTLANVINVHGVLGHLLCTLVGLNWVNQFSGHSALWSSTLPLDHNTWCRHYKWGSIKDIITSVPMIPRLCQLVSTCMSMKSSSTLRTIFKASLIYMYRGPVTLYISTFVARLLVE